MFYQSAENFVPKAPYEHREPTNPALYSGYTPARPFIFRLATSADKLSIIRSAQKKQADYMTTNHLVADINEDRLILAIDNYTNKIVGWCALDSSTQTKYGYHAIKRMMIPNKKYRGQGIAKMIVEWIIQEHPKMVLGATPWRDNHAMRGVLMDTSFEFQYYFGDDDMWCCYMKK